MRAAAAAGGGTQLAACGLRAAEEAEGLWSEDIWEAREQWREV